MQTDMVRTINTIFMGYCGANDIILKCQDNRYQREIFSIVTSVAQYYRAYHKLYCSA